MNQTDTFDAGGRPLRLTPLGHSSLIWEWEGMTIYVDPWSSQADYSTLPKADFVLVTHEHHDHYDAQAVALVRKPDTKLIVNPAVRALAQEGKALINGNKLDLGSFTVEAVPAYNTTEGRTQFHPRGRDNGYILTFGPLRAYLAGDTEDTAEMKALKNIEVAFLPMNQPYTMTPDQVAVAARAFRPRVLYPYHFGETDTALLTVLLAPEKDIEVRIRSLA